MAKIKTFIGIDPGKTGAIVVRKNEGVIVFSLKDKSVKEIFDFLKGHKNAVAVIEEVSSTYRTARGAVYNKARESYKEISTILQLLGMAHQTSTPNIKKGWMSVWSDDIKKLKTKSMTQTQKKKRSKQHIEKAYPQHVDVIKSSDIADAFCMSVYAGTLEW